MRREGVKNIEIYNLSAIGNRTIYGVDALLRSFIINYVRMNDEPIMNALLPLELPYLSKFSYTVGPEDYKELLK